MRQQLERCLEKFRAGQLREADLQQTLEILLRHDKRAIPQRLLYLQAASTEKKKPMVLAVNSS